MDVYSSLVMVASLYKGLRADLTSFWMSSLAERDMVARVGEDSGGCIAGKAAAAG